MIEMLPQILPAEDEEIAKFARSQFERRGISIHAGARIGTLRRAPDGRLVATVDGGGSAEVAGDALIVAAGVQGNIENLELEDLGVRMERGCIAVDGRGRTNVPGIYAIGDVAGPPMLAHKAEHEGVHMRRGHTRASDPSPRPAAHSGLRLQSAAGRQRRPDGGEGEGRRLRGAGGTLSFRRKRQGDRPRRRPGTGEDCIRRDDRKASRRPHVRGRGHRADSWVRGRHELWRRRKRS